MINTNELRIGNLVAGSSDGRNDMSAKSIMEIKYEYVDVVYVAHESFSGIYARDLQGIPLTEEWLVKLGFEDEYENGNFSFKEGRVGFETHALRYEMGTNTLYSSSTQIPTAYVHQLQNAVFVLSGYELTGQP